MPFIDAGLGARNRSARLRTPTLRPPNLRTPNATHAQSDATAYWRPVHTRRGTTLMSYAIGTR